MQRPAGHNGTGRLSVPVAIAGRVPENVVFVPEVTDEGILYRAFREGEVSGDDPAWLKGAAPKPKAKAKAAPKAKAKKSYAGHKPKNPDAPASSPQTWAIWLGTGSGIDVRPLNLTMGEASDILDRLKAGQVSDEEMLDWIKRGAIRRGSK